MLRCFWIKRSLSDYLDGALSDRARQGVASHLQRCPGCRRVLTRLEAVAGLASQKRAPAMSEGFWKKFDLDLDARLDERLAAGLRRADRRPVLAPWEMWRRPAFVTVSLAVLVLAVGLRVLYPGRTAVSLRVAQGEEAGLLSDIELLDEIAQGNGTGMSADDEGDLEMLYVLDPASLEEIG